MHATPDSLNGSGVIAMALAAGFFGFDEKIDLEDLASIAKMSFSHGTREFKQSIATSPLEYVNRLRMLRACEHMRETSSSIGAVAAAVCFKYSNCFNRHFKQVIGATPTQHRRSMQFADPLQISEFKRNYPESV